MYREVKFKDVSCEKQLNRNITIASKLCSMCRIYETLVSSKI